MLRLNQEELHTLGQKIEDSEFSITLLTSLPESLNSFISSIDSSALDKSASLIAHILEEDRRLQSKAGADTVLAARRGTFTNWTCYNCGKKGHKAANCKTPPKFRKRNFQNKKKEDNAHQATSDQDFTFISESAFTVLTRSSWIADSGCTLHMVID
ncbi:hypothetical protein AB1N83_002397 [Pleurotus pulmonarius]